MPVGTRTRVHLCVCACVWVQGGSLGAKGPLWLGRGSREVLGGAAGLRPRSRSFSGPSGPLALLPPWPRVPDGLCEGG